jgi:hypothetical protein
MRVDGVAGPGRCQDLHAAYLTFRGQISTARLRGSALGDDVSATPTLVRVNLERQRSIPDRPSPQHGALRSLSGTLQGPDPAS